MGDGERILLKNIWQIENPHEYKVHFGWWNGQAQPLDEWANDRSRWVVWQQYRTKDEFNRRYIFSLMNFYHEKDKQAWLFGGIFQVLGRRGNRYDVKLTDLGGPFIGRLKLWSSYRARQKEVNFENHYHNLEVLEILREPYSGQTSSG